MSERLDANNLEREVKSLYGDVATSTDGEFHFETGRELAEGLGYDPEDLERVPDAAVDSFAGVGYHVDLAALEPGADVLDLGSGSGMDAFVAGVRVTETGSVEGVDMTPEQVEQARDLASRADFQHVAFRRGYVEDLPFDDGTFDAVVSNGAINLCPEKDRVFEEAARVLRPDGRLALSDIVSERPLPNSIKSSADLWAACIGGAMQVDRYVDCIEDAGFEVDAVGENEAYEFRSERAAEACEEYGVKSVSLAARRR